MSKVVLMLDARYLKHALFLAQARLENIHGFDYKGAELDSYRPEIERLERLISALSKAKAFKSPKKRTKK
jgi:hypothetical protein